MARTTSSREWVAWLSPGIMILVGAVLFFIPLPPTSLIGIALILVGVLLWLVDYFSDGESMEEPPESREELS